MADCGGREGKQLGNYRLLHLLGKGGFAEVYLGEHLHLGTQAAIKVLQMQLASEDIAPFRDEARLIAHLTHPHIVRVLDFAVEDGTPFLVMEYAPGGSLHHRHTAGMQLPLDIIVSYVRQVASALQYAHKQHLIHRDVKPGNMLLGSRGEVLLSDFGMAVLAPHSQSYSTRPLAQEIAGTTLYLAPEQLQGKPQPASDQYSLGVVVYAWLCGTLPFRGTPIEIATQHLSVPPSPLREQVPNLSPAVEEVVLRALAKEPELRFVSVQDFATALELASQRPQASLFSSTSSKRVRNFPRSTRKMPISLTSFIGREQEVAAACALLRQPEVRLLTLTGTGGVGKTRLGLEVATSLLDDFADGVSFVPLAPVNDPDLVIPAIAQTLGLREAGDRPLQEQLKAYLQDQHRLLLLDNFEQVVAAALQLADLLVSCRELKILVTSRAVLRIYGEHEFPVLPLAVPDLTQLPEGEDFMQYASVMLFLERSQAIKPDFQLTRANARVIAEICARLDGIPLAIELAAARMKLLHPQALLARLEHRLQLLTGGAQNIPLRQQTLHNTIAWSYNLLNADEQRLFRRISVFVDGCTLEAIEFLCDTLDHGATQVLDGVESLMNKSLLQQGVSMGNESRLVMLGTIREFGLECLLANEEMETVRQAYAAYYLTLAEEAAPHLTDNQQAVWLARLGREHQNLRVALNWALEQNEAETALRLCVALWWYWEAYAQGHLKEGRHFLEKALAGNLGDDRSMMRLRGRALFATGMVAWIQGDYDHADAYCRESLALCRELGDQQGIGNALHGLGRVALAKRNYSEAHSFTEESLVILRELGDTWGVAYALENLARLAFSQGEDSKALQLLQESLALFRGCGDKADMSWILLYLGRVFIKRGDQTVARSLLEEAVELCKEMGNKWGVAYGLRLLGQLAFEQGNAATARSLLEESLVLHREVGDRRSLALSILFLANVVAFQGQATVAQRLYEESLAIAGMLNHAGIIASCLEGLGAVVVSQQPAWAARLWGKAENLRITAGIEMPAVMRAYYEDMVASAHAQLGENAFATAWAEGRMMTLEQVIAIREPVMVSEQLAGKPPSILTRNVHPIYPAGLTTREVEVLRLVAQGLTDVQIAERLVISRRTINTHLTSIYKKLGVESRAAATRFAMQHRLI
ncbi:MAG: protein kinase domain-containing protein [Ktedonobacteraceae bacterium]